MGNVLMLQSEKNKVTIERAELLTKEGIYGICLDDKGYNIFCEGKKQGKTSAINEEIEFLKLQLERVRRLRKKIAGLQILEYPISQRLRELGEQK